MRSAPRLILLYIIIVLVVPALRSGRGLGQSFTDGPSPLKLTRYPPVRDHWTPIGCWAAFLLRHMREEVL